MSAIDETDTIRCRVVLRNPFQVEFLSFLSKVHKAAFSKRRRVSKRFIGKPAKRLFRALLSVGAGGAGKLIIHTAKGPRKVTFNARNTQFGALYLPQCLPVYEPETSALLDRLVGDNDVFYDIGANWGWYSLLIASRTSFKGAIHAFEPFPSTFADLASLVEQSEQQDRIVCHEIALADKDGQTSMSFPDGVQSGLARLGTVGDTQVRLAKLDSLDISAPSVIKIDAEDHELAVLTGASQIIARDRPFIVFENWLLREQPEITLAPLDLLNRQNYRFFFPGWVSGTPNCIVAESTDNSELALVPFLPAQRFQLPSQINIVAVPVERMDEFRQRFS
jgi:FkbM family methyltransferase